MVYRLPSICKWCLELSLRRSYFDHRYPAAADAVLLHDAADIILTVGRRAPCHPASCGNLPGDRYQSSRDPMFSAYRLHCQGFYGRVKGYDQPHRFFPHLAISLTAATAASTSCSVVNHEKLNLTAPCSSVPSARCMRGAQWTPGLVAIS